jgi:hypothetical protein
MIAGMSYYLAILLKPIGALILFGLIALPLRLAFQRWFPNGPVKRLLLRRVGRRQTEHRRRGRG